MTQLLNKDAANDEDRSNKRVDRSIYDRRKLATGIVANTYVHDEDVNLRDYWHIIINRRWIILLFLFVVLLSTLVATFLMTPIYRASLLLQIEREPAKVLEFQDINPVESSRDKDFYQTQYELLKSRSLSKRVVDELDLYSNPILKKIVIKKSILSSMLISLSGQTASTEAINEEELWINYFLQQLTIEPVKNSRLVRVHFDSPDVSLSAQVINTYADNFINMNLERRFEASSYAKTFLEDRLAQVQAKLEESEQKLVKFARENQIVNISASQNIDSQRLTEMNVALSKAGQDRIDAEATYNQTTNSDFFEVLSSKVVQELKHTLAKLEAQYSDQLKIYKPAYPTMQQLKGQIEKIESKIIEEINSIRVAIKSQFQAALEKEKLLKAELIILQENVLGLQDRSIQYNILQREVQTNRELYQGLLQRMKEVGVAGGISSNNIFIVDAAVEPDKKHKPKLVINMLLALLVGLLGGIGLAFLFEHLDDTLKQADDFEKLVSLPSLGLVPVVSENVSTSDLGLLSHYDSGSMLAEAYRSIRTSLSFGTTKGAPTSLLITSPGPGEGKTTSALNIAITFTQLNKQVLLIDGDLRNPSIHKLLRIRNNIGLSNYLTSETGPADVSQDTEIEGLFVMPAGPVCPNPAELLSSEKMGELLTIAQHKFDYVIIDGPPVLGLADALILSKQVVAVAMIAEAGSTRTGMLKMSVKRLVKAHANIMGGILTKIDAKHGLYGYYGQYYSYERDQENSPKLPV